MKPFHALRNIFVTVIVLLPQVASSAPQVDVVQAASGIQGAATAAAIGNECAHGAKMMGTCRLVEGRFQCVDLQRIEWCQVWLSPPGEMDGLDNFGLGSCSFDAPINGCAYIEENVDIGYWEDISNSGIAPCGCDLGGAYSGHIHNPNFPQVDTLTLYGCNAQKKCELREPSRPIQPGEKLTSMAPATDLLPK